MLKRQSHGDAHWEKKKKLRSKKIESYLLKNVGSKFGNFSQNFWNLFEFFFQYSGVFCFRILKQCPFFRISTLKPPLPTTTTMDSPPRPTATMDSPVHTHPRRKRGAEVSLGIRYAMAVEIALAIPPGKLKRAQGHSTSPRGPLGCWPRVPDKTMAKLQSSDRRNRGARPPKQTPQWAAVI